MGKAKWTRIVLIGFLVLGVGILSAFADDEYSYGDVGGSPVEISVEDYTRQANYFAQQYPDMAPQLNTNIANIQAQGLGPQDMVTMGYDYSNDFGPVQISVEDYTRQANYFAQQYPDMAPQLNTNIANIQAQGLGPQDMLTMPSAGLSINSPQEARYLTTKLIDTQVATSVTGKYKERFNDPLANNSLKIANVLNSQAEALRNMDGETLASAMEKYDTQLAQFHQERARLEKDPTADRKIAADYIGLATDWASGGAIAGAPYDSEGIAGKVRPTEAKTGSQPTVLKADVTVNTGGIFEDPAMAAYYPKSPKITYPSQQPAPVAPAEQESVYSKDWLRGPVEAVLGPQTPASDPTQQPAPVAPAEQESVYSKDWLRGPVEAVLGPQKNNELPTEMKPPKAM